MVNLVHCCIASVQTSVLIGKVRDKEELQPSDTKICHCGRHAKSRMQEFCTSHEQGGLTRCPCVRKGRQCYKSCRCFNCKNKPSNSSGEPVNGCRCGEAGKKTGNVCTDIPGQRRTKCPCYNSGSSCSTERCNCKGCDNSFGKGEAHSKDKKKKLGKCTSSPSPLKRKRGIDFMEENNSEASLGSWTATETCLLDAVESFLHCTCFLPTGENITHLYNHVVNSRFARELRLLASEKTKKQVEGKLNFEKNKSIAARTLAYGIDALN